MRVLVVTGPNTGGKTVALKTAGLLPLMAQTGLLVPAAEGTQVPVFRSVFADIGDEQSIAASLSTFSGHIANIVAMDRALTLPALVLLDEAGGGTDPNEGGALAMAMIDHFRVRGAMVVATTHYDALKSYAVTTDGVTPAGFGFDPGTFAPTYRLNYGAPGSSLALEIATRLGLPDSIIAGARQHRSVREAQLAEHLAKVERDIQSLDHERRLAARERAGLDEAATKMQAREQDLRNREETFRRRLEERIEDRMRDARREIDAVVAALKVRTDAMAADAERRGAPRLVIPTGETGAARAEARAAIEAIAAELRARDADHGRPEIGAVRHARASWKGGGHRRPCQGGRARARGHRPGTPRPRGGGRRAGQAPARPNRRAARPRAGERRPGATGSKCASMSSCKPREGSLSELNVIGCHVDEALSRAEKFLDEALLAEVPSVRLIHGYGTGQLRRAIAEFLRDHKFVARFASAPPEQGGGGVTVVEFKE